MKIISLFNYPNIFKMSKEDFSKSLSSTIFSYFKKENISVIFVSEKEIKEMNKEFRNIDSVTDVLSFNYNSNDIFGEVYVCAKYILKKYPIEEIFRVIIHGILHIYGFDHKREFIDIKESGDEDMYVLQEEILTKFISKIQ